MEKASLRAPIVTLLGHVDHGKTTLLDAIRKTNVASREAGGITQSIGASLVSSKDDKKITFIDTPGHAAFGKMRSRGAKVADIALLVVAADDGIKPQTKEAIKLVQEAAIPFIVVLTKSDLPSAEPEKALSELEKEGIFFEARGGDTPFISVSAKKGEKIGELLELITLLAEVNEIRGDKNAPLEAVVIETSKGRSGPLVSAVVRQGTLLVGQEIFADGQKTKVRGLFNYMGKSVKEVFPGEPCQILGFSSLPAVGSYIGTTPKEAKPEVKREFKVPKDKIPLFLKAASSGSLEALVGSIPQKFVVLGASIGDVTEGDILMAKSAGASVFVFGSSLSTNIKKLAEQEGVKVEKFSIIYDLVKRLEEIEKSGLEVIKGKAEVLASFPFNGKRVAGCKILQGTISKSDTVTLIRGEKRLAKAKIASMKKQKEDIEEAATGQECGIILSPQLDFEKGDVLLSVVV